MPERWNAKLAAFVVGYFTSTDPARLYDTLFFIGQSDDQHLTQEKLVEFLRLFVGREAIENQGGYNYFQAFIKNIIGAIETNSLGDLHRALASYRLVHPRNLPDQSTFETHRLFDLEQRTEILARETHNFIYATTLGVNFDMARIHRYVPLNIYIADSDIPISAIHESTDIISNALSDDFFLSDLFPAQRGSWFQRIFLRTKEIATSEQAKAMLYRGEHAIEANVLGKPQSEANLNNAQAAKAIAEALAPFTNGAIHVGHILGVKTTIDGKSVLALRTLSLEEVRRLEENPALLRDPHKCLELLADAAARPETPAGKELER